MTIQEYVDRLNTRYQTGISREHSYRGDLQSLLETLVPEVLVTNEPARVACGAPDYILTKKDIPVGYIEAKDIGVALGSKTLKEQFDRYRASLDNLIFTDYMDFHLYTEAEFRTSVKIAEVRGGQIHSIPENFSYFTSLINDFCSYGAQTIKSSKKLASMMAGKAKMLSEVLEKALDSDEENQENSTLKEQMFAFRQILIHDIKNREFADIYAQTIAYGMFAARLHDPTLPTFSRQEAAQLIPKTNPFLRTLFQYVAGYDLDSRIAWIVDGLADLFRATDVAAILKKFGNETQGDPIIHFYETFLAEYDPKLRKARGVWYTPEPVVNFIVRAVDDILKVEFDLPQGLADTSTTTAKIKIQTHDKRYKAGIREIDQKVHRVQILDPATGTGTFLAEAVKHIYKKFKGQQGIWSNYVENHLIPRLNGFELLMASYAMAHLKLDLLLAETGYKATRDQRFRVYLTNSLEEHHPDTGSLWATALANEANEANHIKRDTPVMVVMGNPPYSVSSTNKSEWIEGLVADYKKDLKERNIQPLSDDYIKFIRFGQHFVNKNGSGILAFITNNSFIDGLIHRRMRTHLAETFDKIYIIDLHGSTMKNETDSLGKKDENVFDIQQGVSISLFIKKGESNQKGTLAQVYHADVRGKREDKYRYLEDNTIHTISWEKMDIHAPNFFFVPKDFSSSDDYNAGFKIDHLFSTGACGITTERDSLTIQPSNEALENIRHDFSTLDETMLRKKYDLTKDGRDWKYSTAKLDLQTNYPVTVDVLYRPFDIKKTLYTGRSKGFHSYPRHNVMRHLVAGENYSLITCRQQSTFDFQHIFVTDLISDGNSISMQTKEMSYVFPLYLYPENKGQINIDSAEVRVPNLNKEITNQISEKLGLAFTEEKGGTGTFSPVDIFDYIYAVLHSPGYRKKYKEFFKIDFPRVPYPHDTDSFWRLVNLGRQLRLVHLLKSPLVEQYDTQYPNDGDHLVDKPWFDNGNVYINIDQYFTNVTKATWDFYVGGYQPAQKWLKDRKGQKLNFDDIQHYQKLLTAQSVTIKLMEEIDLIFLPSEVNA